MKKVVCFMLAIIMMLSMTVTAFAAGNNNSENAPHIDPTAMLQNWRNVLAVYAVKVSTDEEHGLDVITMDEEKLQLLREFFSTRTSSNTN